jgi:SAM-dependent methyltransferase
MPYIHDKQKIECMKSRFYYNAHRYAHQIARFLVGGHTLLDVGCGSGYVGSTIATVAHVAVTGLDVADYRVEGSALDHHVTYDGHTFPFRAHSYDHVLLSLILHHASDPKRILAESKRVVRKNVIIVEECPTNTLFHFWMIIYDLAVNFIIYRTCIGIPKFRSQVEWKQLIAGLHPSSVTIHSLPRSNVFGPMRTIFCIYFSESS